MANLKSSLKDIERNRANRLRNRAARSAMKTHIKKAKSAAGGDTETVLVNVAAAFKSIDKAAQRGIIHRNEAARRKSRLMKAINSSASTTKA